MSTTTELRTLVSLPGGDIALREGMLFVLTRCCLASAKGGARGVICRACHYAIPDVCGWAAMLDTLTLNDLSAVVAGLSDAEVAALVAPKVFGRLLADDMAR